MALTRSLFQLVKYNFAQTEIHRLPFILRWICTYLLFSNAVNALDLPLYKYGNYADSMNVPMVWLRTTPSVELLIPVSVPAWSLFFTNLTAYEPSWIWLGLRSGSLCRPGVRSSVGLPSKLLSVDTACLGSGLESLAVMDWSLCPIFRTRIVFKGYRGEFFPRPFFVELQPFSIRHLYVVCRSRKKFTTLPAPPLSAFVLSDTARLRSCLREHTSPHLHNHAHHTDLTNHVLQHREANPSPRTTRTTGIDLNALVETTIARIMLLEISQICCEEYENSIDKGSSHLIQIL